VVVTLKKRYGFFVIGLVLLCIAIGLVFILKNNTSVNINGSQETSLYHDQAVKICQLLNKSVALYQAKQFKQAHTVAENAYWNVYDNILEIKYRPYVTPEKIFNVEEQFHQFSNTVLGASDAKQSVTQQAKNLCEEVNKQALFLTNKS
tara:strand:- start:2883 stop:3326 length:444 start_codon:yes stop_codon:yes gene_type:complete